MFDQALPLKTQKKSCSDSQMETAVRFPSVPRMTLTVEETADELHLSRPVAYELVKEPDFPSFRNFRLDFWKTLLAGLVDALPRARRVQVSCSAQVQ